MSLQQLKNALKLWPSLRTFAQALYQCYMPFNPGTHHLVLADGRVRLTLVFKDLAVAMPEIRGQVDAWFLDGFALAKNPDMWSEALYAGLARLSSPGTTLLATFTAASQVKRGLTGAGFQVSKHSGYGQKRHMLAATFTQSQGPRSNYQQKPWLQSLAAPIIAPKTALVLGGGLAGCSAARALAEEGCKYYFWKQPAHWHRVPQATAKASSTSS